MIFFKKEVKFFANSGNSPTSCDTIDTVEYFQTPGGTELPIGIRTVRYYEYTFEQTVRSADAADWMARDALMAHVADEIPEAMLVRRRTQVEQTETAMTLHAYIECIENIARIEEIKIEGISD